MIETRRIGPGAELWCFRDTRFRHGCLSIQLVRKAEPEEAGMQALIPGVLLRGTRKHPDLRSVTMVLDDLYGAAISPLVRSVGDYQTTGLYCSFMEPRFALPGDKVLEPMIDFLRELLWESPVENNGFLAEVTEGEKRNLISAMEADRNDKAVYALQKLLKHVCREDPFGIPRLGEPERVAAIRPDVLLAHWHRILQESPIRICYVGSEEPDRMAELLAPLVLVPGRMPQTLPAQTDLRPAPRDDIEETLDIAQARLCMAFTTSDTIRTEAYAAVQMLNMIYGGGMTSKLFRQVREKQALCYNIGSSFYSTKGILAVSAGIDNGSREQTQAEILRQMELCRRGEISDEELAAAREALVSGLRAAHDSPGAIENYYATAALGGVVRSPAEYITGVEAVTRQAVAEAAEAMGLHTVCFLKGAEDDDILS